MKQAFIYLVLMLASTQVVFTQKLDQPTGVSASTMWVATYYGTWWQAGLPAANLPWNDFTHIIQFHVIINSSDALLFHPLATNAEADNLTLTAHGHGRKVLFSCGPDNNTYWGVISRGDSVMRTLVHNLSDYAKAHNFDGIELDLEGSGGYPNQASYDGWYRALRDTLNSWHPTGLLFCSTVQYYPGFPLGTIAVVNSCFDGVMAMEYDMNLSSPAKSQDPLYQPSCGGYNDSAGIESYLRAGIPPSRLGFGVPFYGRTYSGMTAAQPCSPWTSRNTYDWYPSVVSKMNQGGSVTVSDDVSKSAFISNQAGGWLVTYPDEPGLAARVDFAKRKGLGGMMSYGIAEGHLFSPVPAGHTTDELADWLAQRVGVVSGTTDVQQQTLPTEFSLEQNYPNPFNPTTTITYTLPMMSRVSLQIFDILGQEIRSLVNAVQDIGIQTVAWNATNNSGRSLPTGVYFYRIQAFGLVDHSRSYVTIRKMVLMQ